MSTRRSFASNKEPVPSPRRKPDGQGAGPEKYSEAATFTLEWHLRVLGAIFIFLLAGYVAIKLFIT